MKDVNSLFKQGVAAVKAGQKAKARTLLHQVVEERPDSVNTWLWLSAAVETDEHRRECLTHVLKLDPDNPHAKKGLEELGPPTVLPRWTAPTAPNVTPATLELPAQLAAMNQGRLLTLLGALGLIVGALLPWATMISIFGNISINGIQGDGRITGGIGVLLFISALLAKGKPGKFYSVAGAIFGLIAGIVAASKICMLSGVTSDTEFVRASVGVGVYLSIIGALLVVIGGLRRDKQSQRASP